MGFLLPFSILFLVHFFVLVLCFENYDFCYHFKFIVCFINDIAVGGIEVEAEVEIVEIEEVEKGVAIETLDVIAIEKEVEMTVGEVEMIREGMGEDEEIEGATTGMKKEEKTVKQVVIKTGKLIYKPILQLMPAFCPFTFLNK